MITKHCYYVGNCPNYIGEQLFHATGFLHQYIKGHQVCLVTHDTIAHHYEPLFHDLKNHYHYATYYLKPGEEHKNLQQYQNLIEFLANNHFERDTTLIALGGGIVGDITGFVAATYQRGIHYLQIPTTLIAQVDSAIGGKTGVNLSFAKNHVGAFYQPNAIFTDINFLKTLPQREFIAGLAEVIKYGLIFDEDFFEWLERNMSELIKRTPDILLYAITECVRIKSTIVSQDLKDNGQRKLLNFGHTFGHAIEAATGYQTYLHGEAVAMGMRIAANISADTGYLAKEELQRIETILQVIGIANVVPKPELYQPFLKFDKKSQQRKIGLILLKRIGEAFFEKHERVREEPLLFI